MRRLGKWLLAESPFTMPRWWWFLAWSVILQEVIEGTARWWS